LSTLWRHVVNRQAFLQFEHCVIDPVDSDDLRASKMNVDEADGYWMLEAPLLIDGVRVIEAETR
jgi:hypothetical protein